MFFGDYTGWCVSDLCVSEIQIVCFLLTRLISLLLMVEIEWYIVLFYQEKFCVVLDIFQFWDIDMYVLIQFSLIL